MINDEMNWHCLNQGFCSFKCKLKQPQETFCRNPHNVTGLCNRVSCPLANSSYATVMESEGVMYLYLKTVERAHTPKKLWEKIKLSNNYTEALKQVSTNMLYMPDHQINRCKQRLTKLRQIKIRQREMAKAAMKDSVEEVVGVKKKTERREATRELKAEKAAKVDLAIEKELLDRLKQGVYGNLYMNLDQKDFNKMLDDEVMEEDETEARQLEVEEDLDVEREEEYIMDLSSDEELDEVTSGGKRQLDDDALDASDLKMLKKRRTKPKIEIEYEEDLGAEVSERLLA